MSKWFPAVESTVVVGRFVDVEMVDVPASKAARKNIYKKVPALESKVTGSGDTSFQAVKEWNRTDLMSRFPGAWDYYEQHRVVDEPKAAITVVEAPKGTPLSLADFIPRDKMGWLQDLGFSTIEQLRDMSDSTVTNMGRGASQWRKKAKEHLERMGAH